MFRVWLCVWFACMCLTQARPLTVPKGTEVFVVGTIPGPVSLFENARDCLNMLGSSHERCFQKVLAHDIHFEVLENTDQARRARNLLDKCVGEKTVKRASARCVGAITTSEEQLCAMLAPRTLERHEMASEYCLCEERRNFDFTEYRITTYQPQKFACVTKGNFAESSGKTERKEAPSLEPEAEPAAESSGETVIGSALDSAVDSAGTTEAAVDSVARFGSAIESALFARGSMPDSEVESSFEFVGSAAESALASALFGRGSMPDSEVESSFEFVGSAPDSALEPALFARGSVPPEEEDGQPRGAVIPASVLYGVRYGTSNTAPLSLFSDLETCLLAVMGRGTHCLPYSILKPIRALVTTERVYSEMLRRREDVTAVVYPFARAPVVSGICERLSGDHVRATFLPVNDWPTVNAEPQWFVCPAEGDVISESFSNFVLRAKRLPETVALTAPTSEVLARQPITLSTFIHESQQFMEQRAHRRKQALKLQTGERGPKGKPFFIERVTLTVANPKLHMWGDIHGSIHSLLRTLQQIEINEDWTLHNRRNVLVFLGDYVDRGDYGPEVLYVLMKLFNMNPKNILMVRGNHETKELAEGHGFGYQLNSRFEMDDAERRQIYNLFEQLPAAVYLRDPNHDDLTGESQPAFYMFAHGGIQLSFDPRQLLEYDRTASIIQLAFEDWNPSEHLATNIIRWADIGDEPLVLRERSKTELDFLLSNSAMDKRSPVETTEKQLNAIFSKSGSPYNLLESTRQPGFMWNDMTTDEYPINGHLRVALVADSNRGYVIPKTVVQNYLRSNSIKTIFRAHQHNDHVDNFLRNLQQNNGLFAVYPTMQHRITTRHDYISNGWFTDVVPLALSSAYTLNSSPNSGLNNNFDSYVTLDFDSTGGVDPLFTHRFCNLPPPGSNGIRPESPSCWFQPVPVGSYLKRDSMHYAVEHGTVAVSLFASLSECEIATKKRHRCMPFLTASSLTSHPVTDLQAIATGRFKYADLTYPRITRDIASAVCASSPDTRPPSGWFFPQFTTQFIRQWFICRNSAPLLSQTFSTFTTRITNAAENTKPQTEKAIISLNEFMIQLRLFYYNRGFRQQQFTHIASTDCPELGSAVHVERMEVGNADSKIHIIGSLDGSIHSLIRIMHELGVEEDWTLKNRNDYVVFLGNYYVGSGYGLEALYMIMRLFNMNRDNVILVRGAQETSTLVLSGPIGTEMANRFTEQFNFRDLITSFDKLPAAVYMKDPNTVNSAHPQFMLFTSSGIQLSFNPSAFLVAEPHRRLLHMPLCDRNGIFFASNVLKWGSIGDQTEMRISDNAHLKFRAVHIAKGPETFRVNLERYRRDLILHMFNKPYHKLETSTEYGFMWNDFYHQEESKSGRFVIASTERGMLMSTELLAVYMRQNHIRAIFKTYNRYHLPSLPTRESVRRAVGLAPFSGNAFERVSVDTHNGWADTTIPVGQAPVWILSSASESGLDFHFDSFVTLNWRTNQLTHHHCALPEPTGEHAVIRPASGRCWPVTVTSSA